VSRPHTLSDDYQIWHVGWGRRLIQLRQVSRKSIHRFWLPEVSKFAVFLYLALWLIQHVWATAQPVIISYTENSKVVLNKHTHTTNTRQNTLDLKTTQGIA